MSLAAWLRPDLMVEGVEDIDLDWLARRGIRGLLLDLDNTLTPWRSWELPPAKRAWVEATKGRFAVCLLSNTVFLRRLRYLAAQLGVPWVACWGWGRKPLLGGVRAALRRIGVPAHQAAIVGDQVFADVLAGKRAGLVTILVSPVAGGEDFVTTLLVRRLEAGLRRRWRQEDTQRS
jgi:HAD superfamily phosphatase (TIGR01668 family)